MKVNFILGLEPSHEVQSHVYACAYLNIYTTENRIHSVNVGQFCTVFGQNYLMLTHFECLLLAE